VHTLFGVLFDAFDGTFVVSHVRLQDLVLLRRPQIVRWSIAVKLSCLKSILRIERVPGPSRLGLEQ
jgi:hypothetical protein